MITLEQANAIIAAILARGRELDLRPLAVVVTEPGAIVKAFQKEDHGAMIRFEMAYGKAYAALPWGDPRAWCAPAPSSGRCSWIT